jgi:hypothetical protein
MFTSERESVPLWGQKEAPSPLLNNLKDHILQIKTMILYAILLQALFFVSDRLSEVASISLSFYIPLILLTIVPLIMRVTNPRSNIRDTLRWGLAGLGAGGAMGGQRRVPGWGRWVVLREL